MRWCASNVGVLPVSLLAMLLFAAPTYADLRAPGGRYDEFDVLVPRPLIEPLAHALHLTPETRPLLDACYDRYLVAMLAIETSLDRAAQALEADLATVGVRLPPREGFFMPSPWTDEQRAACNRLLPRMNVERVTHLRQADAALDAFLADVRATFFDLEDSEAAAAAHRITTAFEYRARRYCMLVVDVPDEHAAAVDGRDGFYDYTPQRDLLTVFETWRLDAGAGFVPEDDATLGPDGPTFAEVIAPTIDRYAAGVDEFLRERQDAVRVIDADRVPGRVIEGEERDRHLARIAARTVRWWRTNDQFIDDLAHTIRAFGDETSARAWTSRARRRLAPALYAECWFDGLWDDVLPRLHDPEVRASVEALRADVLRRRHELYDIAFREGRAASLDPEQGRFNAPVRDRAYQAIHRHAVASMVDLARLLPDESRDAFIASLQRSLPATPNYCLGPYVTMGVDPMAWDGFQPLRDLLAAPTGVDPSDRSPDP